ncbi:MAG: hypothetical protein KA166_01515 [Saprospiraceae bacterium]|nr:hypothetical protein [Saprospiraceae bacterium]
MTPKKYPCLILSMIFTLHLSGQKANEGDSTTYYLNQLTGTEKLDTIFLNKLWNLESSYVPSLLADTSFLKAMERLKGVLPREVYYRLSCKFLTNACYRAVLGEYDYPINYGIQFIEELKAYTSVAQKYILLRGMRDIRVPFRNSDRIYEGIETYSALSSYFYQRNDSSAVSITDNVLASFYNTVGLSDKAIYFQLRSIGFLNNNIIPPDMTYLGYGPPPNIGLYGKLNRKSVLGSYYVNDGNPEKALQQLYDVITLSKLSDSPDQIPESSFFYLQIARAHILLKSDSVDFYFNKMLNNVNRNGPSYELAQYYQARSYGFYMAGKLDSAESNIINCIQLIEQNRIPITSIMGSLTPAYYFSLVRLKQNRTQEAIDPLQNEIEKLKALNLRKETLREIKLLAEAFTLNGDYKNATASWEAYDQLLAEMITSEKNNRSISFDIEKRMLDNEKAVQLLESENQYNRKRQYYLLGILVLLTLLAFGLLTRNRYKQKVNKELTRKNKEIESTLNKLQSTQNLLIQSEKMASLGELTAGIAHEIQNPLNFVNNFSELNKELLHEMQAEIDKGNMPEVKTLASTIIANEEKINHHGKRADTIVKGMLQHSRKSNGVKEPTDINALVDEYLRLAYHGLRAKDKSFNATMKTDYDPNIGLINIIPQDIGRVILNLITNAFYAVSSMPSLPTKEGEIFVPTVIIKTRKCLPPLGGQGGERGSEVEISVSDNGPGIPASIIDKIFQPFFTTKPTGQGTGLGLSLSYDIIKAHGGDLKVENKEGEGATFIILLPAV